MTFQEIRYFTETMKSLGYPRLISLDNFRQPNFELVADCLHWLIQRFYPEASITDDISTEAERVKFLQCIAQTTVIKARMKLNLKRLYAADSSAVKELLKLAALLHQATQTATSIDEDSLDAADPATALKLVDAATAAAAASEGARAGVGLHDGLLAEAQSLREARTRALAAAQDTSMVEAGIQETVSSLAEGVASLTAQLTDLAATEAQLATRLEKRRSELERAEKRLAMLAGVLWLHYLERFRNLQYLEAQLEGHQRTEQEAADAAEKRRKKMRRRLAEEELRILRGEAAVDESRLISSRGHGTDSEDNHSADESEDDAAMTSDRGVRRAGFGGARGVVGGASTFNRGPGRMQQQQQDQGAPGQVIGSLNAGGEWSEENDSIDDDTATDGGEVSRAGSGASSGSIGDARPGNNKDAGGYGAGGMEPTGGGGDQRSSGGDGMDDGEGFGGIEGDGFVGLESEDSGF